PCSFLDLAHQMDVLDLVRDLPLPAGHADHGTGRRTVVAVLHELTLAARVADHLVAVAEGGDVAAGPPEPVLTPEALRRVCARGADVIPGPETGHPVVLPRGRTGGAARQPQRSRPRSAAPRPPWCR